MNTMRLGVMGRPKRKRGGAAEEVRVIVQRKGKEKRKGVDIVTDGHD